MSLIIIVVLFVIAWVVLILPKQRELKRHNALLATLSLGDEVMTGSGIYGTLVEIGDDTVIVQVAPGVELKVARRAIASKVVQPVVADGEAAGSDFSDESDESADESDQ
jgi:preprotein translocase subunit YajC